MGGIGHQGAVLLTFDKKGHNKTANDLFRRHIYSKHFHLFIGPFSAILPSQFAKCALTMRKNFIFGNNSIWVLKTPNLMLILSPLEKALKSNKVNKEKLEENGVFVYYCVKNVA